MTKEQEKKLKDMKIKLDDFSKKATKSVKQILGISLLPPKEDKKDDINLLIVVDDRDVAFQEKLKFRDDAFKKMQEIAKKVDENIKPDTLLLEELWQNNYDGKHELSALIAQSGIIYDTGMMAGIKIAEVHKSMVIKKFEKYVVSYVLAGSLVQGKATPESDVDVFVVVDDTDVKKMTRYELRERLRGIIVGMATEAGMMTGIKNKLNVQVYILTDFWDGIKEANPVYFTFLRDGIPFYDRGIFMPWKLLLKMGRIKPSPEAIDMHMSSGEQVIKKTQAKLNEIGMEDCFWSTMNPSQAALMVYGLPPPTPKETPELLREIFVKKEKILEEEYIKILEKIILTRKQLEHDPTKKITGKEIDVLLKGAAKYLKRIKKLFEEIQSEKQKGSVEKIYENTMTIIRDALKLEGVEKVTDENVKEKFKNNLVATGHMPEKSTRKLTAILKAKKDHDAGKLTKAEVDKVRRDSQAFLRMIIDFIQAKRGRQIEKTKIRVRHGEKFAEVTLLGDIAFIVDDIDAQEKLVHQAKIKADGSLGPAKKASLEELEKALATVKIPEKVYIKQAIFDDLKKRYGDDSEVLITF